MTRTWKPLAAASAAVALLAFTAVAKPPPRLIWNASASVPIGLYVIAPAGAPATMDLVVVEPPAPLAQFLWEGGYLPQGAPLLKHVAGVPGQRVCREGRTITVDSTAIAEALLHDRRGRPLPVWSGCINLARGQVFLLNRGAPASLDGRYFGPLPASSIIGRARPLWIPEGD